MTAADPAVPPLVVDASVGVKWVVAEPHEAEALGLLDGRVKLHVPAHFYVEVASTVWKKVVLRGELSADDGRDVRRRLDQIPLDIHPTDILFEIALATKRTVYDCLYIALAARLGCAAVTADAKLYNATRGGSYSARVHWVGDAI